MKFQQRSLSTKNNEKQNTTEILNFLSNHEGIYVRKIEIIFPSLKVLSTKMQEFPIFFHQQNILSQKN